MSPGRNGEGYDVVVNGVNSHDKEIEDITIVGAGPAGLMLGTNLAHYGIKAKIVDDRHDKTSTGRADGLQPKTIETFRQLRLVDPLLRKGVRVYDIAFWHADTTNSLQRTRREIHYPLQLDVKDPFILLVHQGMIEDVFLDNLRNYGVDVTRDSPFQRYEAGKGSDAPISVICENKRTGTQQSFKTRYLVGCDGAHSNVRKSIPGAMMVGESSNAKWGVIDGVIETNFPDLWSKAVVHSKAAGTVLCIPREQNMTRLYIELDRIPDADTTTEITQEFVMEKARQIMSPFSVNWTSVEWFSVYKVGQRVASTFTDETEHIFITGDAGHTHSPKAAQGMNTSMHDSFNLSWKLNLGIRGLAKPALITTYQEERRKIAQDLINFDFEHAAAFAEGNSKALAENFATNVGFISGVGVKYSSNVLNLCEQAHLGALRPGELMAPAQVTRYIDANPVDIQLDIPLLGQFRVYFFVRDILGASKFLSEVCEHVGSSNSVLGRASALAAKSYSTMKAQHVEADDYIQPNRYVGTSRLFTFATVTTMEKSGVEIANLPPLLQASRWTFYMDDLVDAKTGTSCTDKYLGELPENQVAIVNIRPDGYVGAIGRFDANQAATEASKWLDSYYGGFLKT